MSSLNRSDLVLDLLEVYFMSLNGLTEVEELLVGASHVSYYPADWCGHTTWFVSLNSRTEIIVETIEEGGVMIAAILMKDELQVTMGLTIDEILERRRKFGRSG